MIHYLKDKNWRQLIGELPVLKIIEKRLANKEYFPKPDLILNALNLVPMDKIKVVILTQESTILSDYYIGCPFLVNDEDKSSYALKNMITELKREYPEHTKSKIKDITNWCREGVLLLNITLTYEPTQNGKASSMPHENYGWSEFVVHVLTELDKQHTRLLFVSLGSKARTIIEKVIKNNGVLAFGHPSMTTSNNCFSGSDFYKICNDKLMEMNILPIRWWSVFGN